MKIRLILQKLFRPHFKVRPKIPSKGNRRTFKPNFSSNYMENEEEPPGDKKNDKRTNLFGIGNIERCVDNSLLYLRWKTFGHTSLIFDDFNKYARVLCNR